MRFIQELLANHEQYIYELESFRSRNKENRFSILSIGRRFRFCFSTKNRRPTPQEPKTGQRRPTTLPAGHRGAAPRRTSGAAGAAGAAAVATGGAHADGAGSATTGARAQYFGTGVPWIR